MKNLRRGIVRHRLLQRSSRGFYLSKSPYHSLFINPPLNEVPELTTIKLTELFASEIGQAREYSRKGLEQTQQARKNLMELLPKPDDVLPPRKMSDSFVSAIIPLKSQPAIRERYVSAGGQVRVGRLLEDMDVFSVYCCFKHILNPRSVGKQNPYSVVTAMIDTIHIMSDIFRFNEDIRLSGHVTYAGRSSMEVCIIVDQKDRDGVYQKYFDAVFLLVARDPMNKGSARVNPLLASTPEEEEFIKKGAERQEVRRKEERQHILNKPPLQEEMHEIHEGFLGSIRSPGVDKSNVKKMRDSVLRTVVICQPQYRNRYNKVFGGFIMRQAYELAFTNTYIYGRRRPRIVNIDDIKFQLPVEIGSILRLKSFIGYVEQDYVHTVVLCDVIDPHRGLKLRSNELNFTFLIPGPEAYGGPDDPVPKVEFDTYEEAMNYLISRRHYKKMMKDLKFVVSPAPYWDWPWNAPPDN